MFKKIVVIYMMLCISILCTGCNRRSEFIYEMNVGNMLGKAIKVDVVGLGTELDETGSQITSAILNINITNIGAEDIQLEKDIVISAIQGSMKATLIKNTIIEGKSLEPQDIGSYEVDFDFRGKGDVRVDFEVDHQIQSFVITTNYPAKITKSS
ncbi:hypothetical protein [Cellulosilyticum sp. I15G10I2]|uniref:hypothetical protein n=1 Tax=Cellulosilyticum sp. I15G10I2 TaxID=1892843 RepID=UPI00085C0AA3|nr:hypothetical protein [Cellulosilyticum sp. I15G10I2]